MSIKPASRKKAPAAKPKGKKPASSPRKKPSACSACGFKPSEGHAPNCVNAQCDACNMMAGNHKSSCPYHPSKDKFAGTAIDGTAGAPVLDTDVDGKKAKVKVTKPAAEADEEEKPKGITRMSPPRIADPELLIALQRGLDEKVIFGIKQPLTSTTPCEVEWWHDGTQQSVGCSGAAAFDFETPNTCPTCQHTKKAKKDAFCLAHMALRIVNELRDRQISMFDENVPE